MTDTTTISITTDQLEQLKARRRYEGEPMKSVLARLLDADDLETRIERAVGRALEDSE